MLIDLILIALATAGIVHTVQTSRLFEGFRRWVNRYGGSERPALVRWIVAGLQCAYCFAHWPPLLAAVGLLVAPDSTRIVALAFAAIWLANHSLVIFALLQDSGGLIRSRLMPRQAAAARHMASDQEHQEAARRPS